MQTKIKYAGYAPDAEQTTPGIFTSCAAILPTSNGFEAAPSAVVTGLPALAAACQGAAVVQKLDGTNRLFAGTGTKLYESTGTAWTDMARTVGGNYTGSTDTRWSFAQFNNSTLAALKSDTLQVATTGNFADVTGAPEAAIVETVNAFVFLFNTSEGIYGDCTNRWWCAAEGNYTDWTPSVDTNCYTGTLTSSPGKITAGKRFGNSIIAYKERAMYIGYFAGNPIGWDFKEIPGDTGALSNEVVVNIGTAQSPKHIFMGYNDFFVFDGSRPVPLGANVLRDTVYSALNRTYSSCSMALHDTRGSRVYFFYPTSAQVTPDKCVVYNYETNTWGRDDRTVEAVVDYIGSGITYNDLGTTYATYDDLPNRSYDAAFGYSGTSSKAVFDVNHLIKTLTGTAANSSITTGDYGDDTQYTLVKRIKPRFQSAPTTATLTNYYRDELSDALELDGTASYVQSRFDLLREARWHRVRLDMTGDMETTGLVVDTELCGDE